MPPQSLATRLRSHVQALHLAAVGVERPQRDAAERLRSVPREQQAPGGRRVLARQPGQFGVEILKPQVDTQAGGVFAKEPANDVEV